MKRDLISEHGKALVTPRKILIIFAMLLIVSLSARAEELVVGDLRYSVLSDDANRVEVSGYIGEPTGVVIPETVENNGVKYAVTSIGEDAFCCCVSLASVTIPNSVTSIGKSAFSDCTSLASVTIPNSVTRIGWAAFYGCTSLASVTIPNSVTSIEGAAFEWCTSLASVIISNSVTSIEIATFSCCTSLASLTIPNSVISVGEKAFEDCKSLTSVSIPNSVTSIGDEAFYNCTSLASVAIPNSVTSIGDEAFYNCTSLASVTISNSVTNICPGAFEGCMSLTSVTIPNSMRYIGERAFSRTSLTSVTIPKSVINIEGRVFSGCPSLEKIVVDAENPNFSSDNGILYDKNMEALIQCPGTKREVNIPNSVTKIWGYAFEGCMSLASVTIPNSMKSIGWEAFKDCESLRTIYSLSITPPQADGSFHSLSVDLVIYVPEGAKEAYLQAKAWNYFTDIREMTSSVSELSVDQNAGPVDVYDMQGMLVKAGASQADIDGLAPGLYIIGGRKVLVK